MHRVAAWGLVLSLAVFGCRALVGSLDECSTDAECGRLGTNGRCIEKLCVHGTPSAVNDPECSTVFGQPGGVEIGVLVAKSTLSGAPDQRGVYREHAIQLGAEGVQRYGTGGRQIWVRVCDEHNDPDTAVAKASALIEEGAVALITGGSATTLQIASKINLKVPVVSYSASRPDVATAGLVGGARVIWSTAISDALQGRVLARLLQEGAFRSPVSIVNDTQGFLTLHSVIDQETQRLSAGALSVTPYVFRSDGGTDVAGAVGRAIAERHPDVVFPIAVVTETPPIFNAWTGPDPKWIFSDNSRNSSLWNGVDGGLARLVGSRGTGPSAAPASSTAYSLFHAEFVGRFGVEPSSIAYVPNAYDAFLLVAAAVLWADVRQDVSPSNVALGLTHLSDTSLPSTQLEPSVFFTVIRRAFEAGKNLNVQGASGDLDLDPATGFAPGPVDEWEIGADGTFLVRRQWTQVSDGGLVAIDAQ